MEQANFITSWHEETLPNGSLFRIPLIAFLYSIACNDITEQPATELLPDPNWLVVEAQAETAVIDQIAGDDRFDIVPGTRTEVVNDVEAT